MSDLLEMALEAHGGLDRWRRARTIVASASITGAMWGRKGHTGALAQVVVEVDAHEQHVRYSPFLRPGIASSYQPDRVCLVTDGGDTLAALDRPRATFAGHTLETRWSELQLAYFSGYAMWTYLTTPFLFTMQGFKAEEVEPWQENGEKLRRLRVTFPDYVESHSSVQDFYFGEDGILRRQDYRTEISGDRPVVLYASEAEYFDGLVFPTRRRAFARGPDNFAMDVPVGVAIDFHDIRIIDYEEKALWSVA